MAALMSTFDNDFELIYFTDSFLGEPTIFGDTLEVFVRNIGLLPNHTMNQENQMFFVEQAKLKFNGVRYSQRTIHRYAGNPKTDGFLPSYIVTDVERKEVNYEIKVFELEGVLEQPQAWVDWLIEANSVTLQLVL